MMFRKDVVYEKEIEVYLICRLHLEFLLHREGKCLQGRYEARRQYQVFISGSIEL